MKYLELSRGLGAIVDDDTFGWASKFKWNANTDGYAVRKTRVSEKHLQSSKAIFLHREILKPRAGFLVDHINRDKLDNRKSNLRLATRSQSQQNRAVDRDSKSGYKGVFCMTGKKVNKDRRWRAMIRVNNQHFFLGYYNKKETAARIYNDAARKYFGEFAVLNNV